MQFLSYQQLHQPHYKVNQFNMCAETSGALAILAVQTKLHESLRKFGRSLSKEEKVSTVGIDFEWKDFTELPRSEYSGRFSAIVKADLESGEAVAWSLALFWREQGWFIQGNVSRRDGTSAEIVDELPRRTCHSLEDLMTQVESAVSELTQISIL
jgi:hypothetical protein